MECEKVIVRRYGGGSLYFLIPNKVAWMQSIEEGDEFLCQVADDGIIYEKNRGNSEKIEDIETEEIPAEEVEVA